MSPGSLNSCTSLPCVRVLGHMPPHPAPGNGFQMAYCPVGWQEELIGLIDIIAQPIKCSKCQPTDDNCALRELILEH